MSGVEFMNLKSRSNLVQDAYLRLKQEIRSNRLPPGFHGTEPEMAERLGMSRTPLREALVLLETDGLVEMKPRRGIYILPILPQDMQEIYELLTAIEPEAAASLAARQLSDDQLQPLSDETSKMEQALEDDDLEAWADADDMFHRALLTLHGNQRLLSFANSLFDQAHRARVITLRMREKPYRSTQEHKEVVQHIRDGDVEKAQIIYRQHRERTGAELMAILDKYKLQQL
jgi:DNA-binding GntR family transcriptional regulator